MGLCEVQAAFDILTEEIDGLIPEIIKQGNSLIESRSFDQARKVIDQAEALEKFKFEVLKLNQQWNSLVTNIPTNLESLVHEEKTVLPLVSDVNPRGYQSSANQTYVKEQSIELQKFLKGKTATAIRLFNPLQDKIHELSPYVTERYHKMFITFVYDGEGFVRVVFLKDSLNLLLLPKMNELKDPYGLARDVSTKGTYGKGNTEANFSRMHQLDNIMDLVKQSYFLV